MGEIPSYIKILYVMFLKNNYTIDQIKNDTRGNIFNCTYGICGIWEGYALVAETRNEVIGFINKYGILQKNEFVDFINNYMIMGKEIHYDYRFRRDIYCSFKTRV